VLCGSYQGNDVWVVQLGVDVDLPRHLTAVQWAELPLLVGLDGQGQRRLLAEGIPGQVWWWCG